MSQPRFKVGDTVYGKPLYAVWPGQVVQVFLANETERKLPCYIICFANWGECARYEDEIYPTEKEAYEENH